MEEELDQLAFRFFKLFAQYESELKDMMYFVATKSGNIIVDWDRFVNERIGEGFLDDLGELATHAEFILAEPPMRQVVGEQGLIEWQEVTDKDKSIQALFGHISRMRNNLYHGAKFNGTWFDPDRSYRLLTSGLKILEHFKGKANIHKDAY